MGTKIRRLAFGLAVFASSSVALARQIAYGGKPQTITVSVGTPALVRFERPVKTVTNAAQFSIKPASEENPDYTTLIVEARTSKASSFVNFILADGAIVRTKLVAMAAGAPEGADNVYDFKIEEGNAEGAGVGATQAPEVKAIDLMKAMIRGDKVMTYEVRELKKALQTGNAGVGAELVKIYAGADFNGYVFHLVNATRGKTFAVDIRGLRLGEPNLAVLSQCDRKTLMPLGSGKNEAYLRIVARAGSTYRDIVLPVAAVKKEKGGQP